MNGSGHRSAGGGRAAAERLTLADLARVKKQIDRERAEAARRELLERQAREAAERERQIFRHAVGEVVPLDAPQRVMLAPPPPEPIPRQRELDERAALLEALSDEMDVERLLETDDGLSFRRRHIGPDILKRLRRGQWTIQAEVDLHGLRRDEAREALQHFVRQARRRGQRCVRVIHGKGLGSPGKSPVLKSRVRAWLIQMQSVLAFVQARASQGGHGAVVVLLAPAEHPQHTP